jgi:hypothetical protein
VVLRHGMVALGADMAYLSVQTAVPNMLLRILEHTRLRITRNVCAGLNALHSVGNFPTRPSVLS